MENMAFPNPNHLLIVIFLIIINNDLQNTAIGCIVEEREALMKFKASFYDPRNRLSAWSGDDCCSWQISSVEVGCDEVSGHITWLDISTKPYLGGFFAVQLQSPKLDPSLSELKYLSHLDLSGNDFQLSPIPSFLGSLKHLERLNLAGSNFSGPIPSSFGNLSNLTELILGSNQISGEIPVSLGMLSNLETLHLPFNSLNGTLSEAHFSKLYKLKNLYTGFNYHLKLRVGLDWVPPFQLKMLQMQSCDIGGQFPLWLRTQKDLGTLDLSNCSISGILPDWFQNNVNLWFVLLSHNNISGQIVLPSHLYTLDISHNAISVPLPRNIGHLVPHLRNLFMTQNFISGTIPDSLCDVENLETLDLSKNQLSGTIPTCLGNLGKLNVLRVSSNELSGVIPDSISGAYSLEWLHLNNNSFTGKLPPTLKNCTYLKVLDIGENNLSGNLPKWIGEYLIHLTILRLRNNDFEDTIPSEICQLSRLQIMDLANNKFTGLIPSCFSNFSGMVKKESEEVDVVWSGDNSAWNDESSIMVFKGLVLEYTKTLVYLINLDLSNNKLRGEIPGELTKLHAVLGLNLSHNHFTGKIPRKIGDMRSLESLDLSCNNLVGTIPGSLSELSLLSYLNLSHNNLSGQIPTGHQLQTLDKPSFYEGNPELCGVPLSKRCNEAPNVERHAAENEENDANDVWFYGVIVSGFATGFWGFFGVLIFKRSWRHAYFSFVEFKLHKLFGV